MHELIVKILQKSLPGIGDFEVSVPDNNDFGHYSTNLALKLGKAEGKNPMVLAGELAVKIEKAAPKGFFKKVEAVTPGFINFWLSEKNIQNEFLKILKDINKFGKQNLGKGKTIIVEYSSTNIAKPMHVGHLRSTIIGDALANLYDSLGYKVVRWNYLGDWGTQFGKLIAAYKLWGDRREFKKNPIRHLLELYIKFNEEEKNQSDFQSLGQLEFKKLENGDRENVGLWKLFRAASLKEFNKIYKILGVKFNEIKGESYYEKDLKPLIKELSKKGVAKESEGSMIIPLDKFDLPPGLIRKSDGASLYLTREIATLKQRIKEYKPEKILYVVGNQQALHFEQLFAVAKILNLRGAELSHIKFGTVLGEDRKKFATREGKLIPLEEVINKAIKLAHKIVSEKNSKLSHRSKTDIAKTVGIGAIKYNDLKENRNSDIIFNWERMLDFSGQSAPYLQYTYARLASIKKKAKPGQGVDVSYLATDLELEIIRRILEYPEILLNGAKNCLTSGIAEYLYKLANLANRFYESAPILKDEDIERRNARLKLIEAIMAVLEKGLGILGIKTLKQI